MAESVIKLYNDITNNVLVKSLSNAETFQFSAARLFQDSKLPFRYYPVQAPDGLVSAANPYELVDVTGITLDVAIGPRAGVEAVLARQNSWAINSLGYLEAVLNLNTAEMAAAIASSETLSSFIEIKLTDTNGKRTVYQEAITITAVVIGPDTAASLPSAAVEYWTAAEIQARCVRFVDNPAGATISLLSPDGAHERLIGCNNNATALDEVA